MSLNLAVCSIPQFKYLPTFLLVVINYIHGGVLSTDHMINVSSVANHVHILLSTL